MQAREGSIQMQYSNDLRRKLVEAWQAGAGTQAELAEVFGVSLGWVEKVLRRWRETGDTAAPVFRHGPVSRLQPARVERLVKKYPDATLAELGHCLKVSPPTLCRWLQRLGLRRKKVTARQRTRHAASPATPGKLAANPPSPITRATDLCGRKRCKPCAHPALCPGSARGAGRCVCAAKLRPEPDRPRGLGLRWDPSRLHCAGRDGSSGVSELSGASTRPATQTGSDGRNGQLNGAQRDSRRRSDPENGGATVLSAPLLARLQPD